MIKLKNILSALTFIFAITFIFSSAIHSLEEPLERDLTTYGYIGHALLSGEHLYTELWDHKPPGIHIAFALSELIWGYGQQSLSFLWVIVNILSVLLIYMILDKISGWQAGLVGITFWVLSSNSAYLQANQPNTEIFLNLFTLIAMWALIQNPLPRMKHLHLAGWAMGIATIFKPVAIFVLVPILFYVLLQIQRSQNKHHIKMYLQHSLMLLYPVPLLWLSMFGYALLVGRFKDYWDILIVYNSQYSGNSLANIWAFLTHPAYLFPSSLDGIWIIVLLSYAWLFVGSRSKRFQIPHYFYIFMMLGILFEIGSIGRNYPHYNQTLFPVLAINSSLLIIYIFNELEFNQLWRWLLGGTLVSVALGTMINHQIEFFKLTPVEVSHEKYRNQFIDAWEMGLEIKAITNPDESIYYWGSESGIYYYSQRRAASGIFYNLPLKEKKNKRSAELMSRLLADLEASPPSIFIWNSKEGKLEKNRLHEFVSEGYHLLGNRSYYQIYVRNLQ